MWQTCVDKNSLFVVDLENLRDPKDITYGNSTDPLHSVMMMCKDTMKNSVRIVTGAQITWYVLLQIEL